jgi:hypothetical protein
MGRIKLGANVLGAAKQAINDSVKYANERKQFNTFISTFGAIKHKLAEQVIKTFAAESATYRLSNDIDDLMAVYKTEGCDKGKASIDAISHYAVEAAILKVYGSEVLDYVIDEALQIHGGMGYSAELPVEKGYRDSRINRIFEGTNEINRLLVIDTAMKRALKGDFDMFGEAEKIYTSLDKITDGKIGNETYYQEKKRLIKNFKKAVLLLTYAASKHFEKNLVQEQEILNNLTDMTMETYISESTALRVEKIESIKGSSAVAVYKDILDVNIYEAVAIVKKAAYDAINSFVAPADTDKMIKAIDSLTSIPSVNIKDARRRIANKLIEDNAYKF